MKTGFFLVAASVAAALWLDTAVSRKPVERSMYLMGTRAHLITYAAKRDEGIEALEVMFQVLNSAEHHLSTWRDDSAVSAINHHAIGVPHRVDPGLCNTLASLYQWHKTTSGTFDPAIGRLVEAWDLRGRGRLASDIDLVHAKHLSGLQYLEFSHETCSILRTRDVALDAGGFGKGDALDRVARALPEVPWLIDLGGQITVGAPPPTQVGWEVSIAHPLNRAEPCLQILMKNGSLATSAGSERDLNVEGHRVGHILDPRTGQPATFMGSVTVQHQSSLVPDILSTALYVMGPEEGLLWAEEHGINACYLIPQASGLVDIKMTSGFKALEPQLTHTATIDRPTLGFNNHFGALQ